MRVSSRFLRLTAALCALLALSSHTADAVTACTECASGKVCVLESKDVLPTGQNSFTMKVCNYDTTKASQYKLEFALAKPLACDADGALLPKPTSLTPVGECTTANCVLTVNLAAPVDWAIAMLNSGAANVLQAKFTGDTGDNTLVQVATGTGTTGALLDGGNGDSVTASTVCSTQFGVKATRLSTLAACNVVTLCTGKSDDTGCPTPFSSKPLISGVVCTGETCTGTLTLTDPLPCTASTADSNSLLASVTVGNSAGSSYTAVATLSAAPAAKISSVSGVSVGSQKLTIKSDASCLSSSLAVNVSTLSTTSNNSTNGTITVALASALGSSLSGQSLDVTVSQCGVSSSKYTVKVSADDTAADADDSTTDGSSDSNGSTVGSPTGSVVTQKDDASTGLSGGLYIAIGVGALAAFGFLFECWYHKRRHSKEFSNQGPADNGNHAAV